MRAGRILAAILAGLVATAGFGALAAGGALVAFHLTQRGPDGYYTSPAVQLLTPRSVLVTEIGLDASQSTLDDAVGTVRVAVTARDDGPVFTGIAPLAQVEAWLAGTGYTRVTGVDFFPLRGRTELVAGTRAAAPEPEQADFWVASAAGPGEQRMTWRSEPGTWALVVMNADGGTGVAVDVRFAVATPYLLPVALAIGAVGLLVLSAGVIGLLLAVRAATPVADPAPGRPGSYPVRLDATLEPNLSRWLWLVKWLLALPHLVVLALLWLAVAPLTVIAGIAILVTGRYPRSIFEFTVGVMRWSWRVTYYGFSPIGTDRYPPMHLRPDPGYPADLTVEYPQRLSRGLVLVKWWLLAIPHYLVVAFFAGGVYSWESDDGRWSVRSAGLVTVLVLVACVILLFTGRYPRGLFDFVMGMNRWCARVLAYAALLRDEYPPWRFDAGGPDPGTDPGTGPGSDPGTHS